MGRSNISYRCQLQSYVPDHGSPVWVSTRILEGLTWLLTEHLLSPQAESEYRTGMAARRSAKKRDSLSGKLLRRKAELTDRLRYNLRAAQAMALDLTVLAADNEALTEELQEIQTELDSLEIEGPPRFRSDGELRRAVEELQRDGYQRQLMFLERVYRRIEIFPDVITYHFHDASLPPLSLNRGVTGQYNRRLFLDFAPIQP